MLQEVNGKYELSQMTIDKLIEWENTIKEIKAFQDEYKAQILKEMEENGCNKIENDQIRINYTEPTYRETFDTKWLKENNPEMYNDHLKISNVSSSIRITIK